MNITILLYSTKIYILVEGFPVFQHYQLLNNVNSEIDCSGLDNIEKPKGLVQNLNILSCGIEVSEIVMLKIGQQISD